MPSCAAGSLLLSLIIRLIPRPFIVGSELGYPLTNPPPLFCYPLTNPPTCFAFHLPRPAGTSNSADFFTLFSFPLSFFYLFHKAKGVFRQKMLVSAMGMLKDFNERTPKYRCNKQTEDSSPPPNPPPPPPPKKMK
jgi:hypothetical protein